MNHILGHKINLNKLKRAGIIQSVLPNKNRIKLEINNRNITGKSLTIWKLNNTFLHNPWIKEENLKGNKKEIKLNENESTV